MFTRSHTIIIKKLGHRFSILIAALYSLIPGLQSLVTSLQSLIPLFQVFLSQNVAVPSQKLRCSRSIPRPFQRNSIFCSKWFSAYFAQAFLKILTCCKSEENYTKTTPKLHRVFVSSSVRSGMFIEK